MSGPASRRVLVTHADEPVGRRLVKSLIHDPQVETVWAVGRGRIPRSFDAFLRGSDGGFVYSRAELSRHRPVAELFRSPEFRAARIDTLVHVPRHGAAASGAPVSTPAAGLADRTAEARLVLQHALESTNLRQLVAIGSAFVYRLEPGNSNRFTEESPLDLDPDVDPELRGWIDCDMIFHGEVHNERLAVTLLRAPTVVSSGGYVFLNPALSGPGEHHLRPLGFDPLCTLISDKDLARATLLAIHRRRPGIFNVSGRETIPLSLLSHWTGGTSWSIPGPVLRGLSRARELWGGAEGPARMDGPHLRYGFSLDTSRAERELGFRAGYRIGLSRAGDGRLRVETAPA